MSAHAVDPGDVLAALADPTRRTILERLSSVAHATATELAEDLPVSRQAVAKHLATLRRVRLVSVRRHGREARFVLEPAGLRPARSWLDATAAAWDDRLDRLARLAEEE